MAGQQPRTPPTRWSPWVDVALGLFMCFGTVVLFFFLARQEATGERFSMNVLAVYIYELGGKWLLSSLTALVGVVFLVVGIRRLMNPPE